MIMGGEEGMTPVDEIMSQFSDPFFLMFLSMFLPLAW